jgi:hypothetical protein
MAPSAARPARSRVGSRRLVGFSPITPHQAAGIRSDPAPSLPVASGTTPAATAAAEPADEPPGLRSGRHGLAVGPSPVCPQVCQGVDGPGTEVRPRTTQPSRSRRSVCGPCERSHAFTPIGTPASRSCSPRRTAWSTARAASSARSGRTCVNARSTGAESSSRASAARTVSCADTSRRRTRSAVAVASSVTTAA